MLEQGERLSLAQAFDGIRDQFGVSNKSLGALAAAMVLVGVVGGIPFGALADRWRRSWLLVIAMLVWTTCMGLGAIAPTFLLLFISRLGVGAVEANGPASFSLMSDYYPVSMRARMMGRYQMGAAVGGLVGIGLSGVLVDTYGWRAAFWMWIPFGLLVAFLVSRLPEPERGAQDRDFHYQETFFDEEIVVHSRFDDASWMDVFRELLKIRSMWFGLMALTISGFFSTALQVWGIDYFKQQFDLSAKVAGALTPAIGAGAAVGLIGGGELADWLLKRGILNARVFVTAGASMLATVFFLPAFFTHNLAFAAVCLFFGSLCMTAPVAPSEALTSDVIPAPLRGRAAAIRSIVRALSALAPLIVGALADHYSLATSLAIVSPLYAIGGVVMLFAARTYPTDLESVAARARAIA
jgi:predicted MFS family arabinose efflux permease